MTHCRHVKIDQGDWVREIGSSEIGEAISYNLRSHKWKVWFDSGERDVLPRNLTVLTYKDGQAESTKKREQEIVARVKKRTEHWTAEWGLAAESIISDLESWLNSGKE